LTTPPFIPPRVFKDDVDEGTTDYQENVGWDNNLEHLEHVEKTRIH
jgi:hypothetical protein